MKPRTRFMAALAMGLLAATTFTGAAEPRLTREQVVEYIEARIASHRIQMEMKANADRYDNVIQSFYKKREAMLADRGLTVEEFERRRERVSAVKTAMREAEKRERNAPKLAEKKKQIRENPHFTDEQKQQMIKVEERLHNYATPLIEKTRPDWPAVEPYRDELEQLTDWVAGNVDEPPEV